MKNVKDHIDLEVDYAIYSQINCKIKRPWMFDWTVSDKTGIL